MNTNRITWNRTAIVDGKPTGLAGCLSGAGCSRSDNCLRADATLSYRVSHECGNQFHYFIPVNLSR